MLTEFSTDYFILWVNGWGNAVENVRIKFCHKLQKTQHDFEFRLTMWPVYVTAVLLYPFCILSGKVMCMFNLSWIYGIECGGLASSM